MPFERILKDLASASGASGAAMVDHEGEIVATAGDGSADLALLGAHHAVVIDHVKEASSRLDIAGRGAGAEDQLDCMTVSTKGARLVLKQIKEGYFILLLMDRGANTARALYQAGKSADRIREEMG